ncbi:MAG: class I SAM-dependent methyltransferase [Bacteroidetes bacterium]|nr:class I SAM-dependent methyltransferase [Bacteroidota bacterium]MCY4223427.1 class I SAM-dependent methyltransferase [Bacteroidota bacterium]
MAKRDDFSQLNSGLSGRDQYDSFYSNHLDREAEWLRRGAEQKANAISLLLDQKDLKPKSILDIGCGTGAVTAELTRRKIGESFHALDYSEDAIQHVKETLPHVNAKAGDISDCSKLFPNSKFDLLICSHVIEHLEYPQIFLKSLTDVN